MGELVSIKRTKTKKIKSEDVMDNNPLLKHKLNEISMEYIEKVHKIVAENTDVQAVVRVSFEFFRE
jgi:hypothetical protein